MRDKKDQATLDLPGFGAAVPAVQEVKRASGSRIKKPALKQVQLALLEPTDSSGLPLWQRDDKLDLTGLPNWAPA
jgi:hypothetical protein